MIQANIDVARALTSALVEKGQLLGKEVDRIIADTIAKRQLVQEYARRAEWRRREDNARAFEAKTPMIPPTRPLEAGRQPQTRFGVKADMGSEGALTSAKICGQ